MTILKRAKNNDTLTYVVKCNFYKCVGAFLKLRKATTNFVISCLSIYPNAWNTSTPNGCNLMNCYLSIIRKHVLKFQVSYRSYKSNRHFTWRLTYILDNFF
jgi:hypothetical protein